MSYRQYMDRARALVEELDSLKLRMSLLAGEVDKPSLVPDGLYHVVVAASQTRQSKVREGGEYITLTYVVIEGEHTGRVLYQPLIENGRADWPWEAVVSSPYEIKVEDQFRVYVTTDDYQGQRRNRCGKMIAP